MLTLNRVYLIQHCEINGEPSRVDGIDYIQFIPLAKVSETIYQGETYSILDDGDAATTTETYTLLSPTSDIWVELEQGFSCRFVRPEEVN